MLDSVVFSGEMIATKADIRSYTFASAYPSPNVIEWLNEEEWLNSMEILYNRFEDAASTVEWNGNAMRKKGEREWENDIASDEDGARVCAGHTNTQSRTEHFIFEINKFLKLILFDNWFISVVVTGIQARVHRASGRGDRSNERARVSEWVSSEHAAAFTY